MIADDVPCSKIASELGNGLSENDIRNRWHRELKVLSGIIKPPGKTGPRSSITWTVDVDATIGKMRTDGISFAKIASKLGNGLKDIDIRNRWNSHLKVFQLSVSASFFSICDHHPFNAMRLFS